MLERAPAERRVLVITHLLSTVQGADGAAVVEAERVVECGAYMQLLGAGGASAALTVCQ